MTPKRRPPPAPSAEVTAAYIDLYDRAMFQLMIGIVRADGVEERYLRFHEEARQLAKKELRTVARSAAEYFVAHAKPSPENLPREQVHQLTEAAIEHALQAPAP